MWLVTSYDLDWIECLVYLYRAECCKLWYIQSCLNSLITQVEPGTQTTTRSYSHQFIHYYILYMVSANTINFSCAIQNKGKHNLRELLKALAYTDRTHDAQFSSIWSLSLSRSATEESVSEPSSLPAFRHLDQQSGWTLLELHQLTHRTLRTTQETKVAY